MKKGVMTVRPWCPFCGVDVDRPRMGTIRKMSEFPMGRCQCGAVYTGDATGHNIGAAMVECLVYACNDNWDLAWDLEPETDYLTDLIEHYDEVSHQVVETGNLDGRRIKGVLYFVRLQQDIVELVEGQPALEETAAPLAAPPAVEPVRDPKRQRRRTGKQEVAALVAQGDVDTLVDLCFDDQRTLRLMQRLIYDPDEASRWWTAHVIGRVCGRVSTLKPGTVSDLLQRLFEACLDSASANWGALETIGAIIAARADLFGPFAKHLLQFAGDPSMRGAAIWALGTVAGTRPGLVRTLPFYGLLGLLQDGDPAVRGLVARLLGRLGATEATEQIARLQGDAAELVVYEEGRPVSTTVGELAVTALEMIGRSVAPQK